MEMQNEFIQKYISEILKLEMRITSMDGQLNKMMTKNIKYAMTVEGKLLNNTIIDIHINIETINEFSNIYKNYCGEQIKLNEMERSTFVAIDGDNVKKILFEIIIMKHKKNIENMFYHECNALLKFLMDIHNHKFDANCNNYNEYDCMTSDEIENDQKYFKRCEAILNNNLENAINKINHILHNYKNIGAFSNFLITCKNKFTTHLKKNIEYNPEITVEQNTSNDVEDFKVKILQIIRIFDPNYDESNKQLREISIDCISHLYSNGYSCSYIGYVFA